jgi:U3 small nucleolar RNA-associated protein 4
MLELHRSRFVEWQPAAVVALAVTPGGLTVALARENGDLEIYDTADWRCTARVPGHDGAAISSVAWCAPFDGGLDDDGGDETCVAGTPPYRLLSAGLDGQITEWDLSTLRARGATDSHGGSVWALAAEPNVGKDKPQRVAAACDDGCVRLLTLTAGDGVGSGLHHRRSFNRVEGRLLSLSWLHDGKTVAAGSSRGCIHVFDCATFTELTRVTVGDGDRPGKRDTDERCVWALSYLPCGTLVSGTSDGDVTFWDKKFGTKIASHRQHAADVLALAASPCGTCVFASGVDSQIAVFEKVTNGDDSKEDTWTFTGTKRPHTHDVRALAMAAAPSGVGDAADGKNWYSPVLLSGGNDAQLLAFNALKFRKRHPVRVVSTPQRTPIAMTGGGAWTAGASSGKNGKNVKGKKRTADEGDTKTKTNTAKNASAPNPPLLLCDHARWLDLWRLGSGVGADLAGKTNQKRHDGTVKLACAPKHLLRAKLGGKRRTACAAVSPDGAYLLFFFFFF